MNGLLSIVLAAASLSIYDYPVRQSLHLRFRDQFIQAMRTGDTQAMEAACRRGVTLLPDDPTWHYNLACSLAYFPKREDEAFDELEKAIDLGFRDEEAIRADTDLKRLAGSLRYEQLILYAHEMKLRPLMFGPLATVDATGVFGRSVALGEQNLAWDFDTGCFTALLKLAQSSTGPNVGDLYMNRDANHSRITLTNFVGITEVRLDSEGRKRRLDQNIPNIIFPYPTFGNCSQAFMGPLWRSIPRALTTKESIHLAALGKMYCSNQLWFFPSNADTAPVGTNGDVFASITPYWITTAGRSWSDLPYLSAALRASGAFRKDVKQEIVRRGLLAPTIFTLLRKSLGIVPTEDDYLTPRAHPTAMPPNALNEKRLLEKAAAMTVETIPPLARMSVAMTPPAKPAKRFELLYATPHAWAFVLRSEDEVRTFQIKASGAETFAFFQSHGAPGATRIERLAPDTVKVTVNRAALTPTKRVDICVVGKNAGTGWGPPSYLSIARMDPTAPYSDPVLTDRPDEASSAGTTPRQFE